MKTHTGKLILIFFFALAILPAVAPAPVYAASPRQSAPIIYRVKRGDTLYSIARRYGVTVSAIKGANGLRSSNIFVNQTLTIPRSSSSRTTSQQSADSSCRNTYRVRSGDTLSSIARRCRTSVSRIKSLNGLNSSVIHIGQTLRLSGQTNTNSSGGKRPTPKPTKRPDPTPDPPAITWYDSIPTPYYGSR